MNYNKMFQRIVVILETGEYILRQTARKLEKEVNPLIEAKLDGWKSDLQKYPEFYKLLLGEEEYSKQAKQHNESFTMQDYVQWDLAETYRKAKVDQDGLVQYTARRKGKVKAFKLTENNFDAAYEWISSNPHVWTSMKLTDSIRFKSENSIAAERAFIGNWIIEQVEEEFDEAIYHLYVYTNENFIREFSIETE